MQLIFSDSEYPTQVIKSIFLAGPSPRRQGVLDWRNEALSILEAQGFDGTVFIPIPYHKFYEGTDTSEWTYDNQIKWECEARARADLIVFWVPRDIEGEMPGFTTNVEFGEDLSSGKIIYGRPDSAEKCRYLDKRITDMGKIVHNTLSSLLMAAIDNLEQGALRQNGETQVPLFIWKTQQFQLWYDNLKQAGNRLEGASLLHHFPVGRNFIFSYILKVNIWVEAEQRFKSNEFVFSRKDTSNIVAYYKEGDTTYVVLVKEFRSPVSNKAGFVYELPGGSAFDDTNYELNAQHELQEETGFLIEDLSRFKYIDTRQLCSTLSSHKAQVYSVELTAEEFSYFTYHSQERTTFGLAQDSEITYIEVVDVKSLNTSYLDYSMLGMIYYTLAQT